MRKSTGETEFGKGEYLNKTQNQAPNRVRKKRARKERDIKGSLQMEPMNELSSKKKQIEVVQDDQHYQIPTLPQ